MPGRLGAVGRHAIRQGIWFNTRLWTILVATLSWLILMLRQVPCHPTPDSAFPNAYLRMCYTDISTLYLVRDIATGKAIYAEIALEYPVLTGYMVMAGRFITGLLGHPAAGDLDFADRLAAAQTFFHVTAVALFCCFLVLVITHLKMSPDPTHALFVAASPLVMLAGLINWDLLAVMLTSVAIYLWMNKHPWWSGIVIGLAFSAKFYPAILLIAITLLCLRSGHYRPMALAWAGSVLAWTVVNLPVMVFTCDGWAYFWTTNSARGADLGSIWYVFKLVGLPMGHAATLARMLTIVAGLAICWLVARAPRRPRLTQIAYLLLFVFLAFNTVYSPQYCLWLLPIAVLARPDLRSLAGWTVSEVVYYVAIWGFLEGIIGPGSGSDWLYWFAVIVRITGELWFALLIVDDISRPWEDPVRQPLVDDPIGGVLDHSADGGILRIGHP